MELFAHRTISRSWIALNVIIDNPDDAVAQGRYGRELTHVNAGQLLRQGKFLANRKCPMRKVIRKTFADKVVLFQGAEGMLKDRIFRARAQPREQLRQRARPFPPNAQNVCRAIEVEGLACRADVPVGFEEEAYCPRLWLPPPGLSRRSPNPGGLQPRGAQNMRHPRM